MRKALNMEPLLDYITESPHEFGGTVDLAN